MDRVIDMPRCQFVPRVVAARTGDVLKAKNLAPITHALVLYGSANEFARVLPALAESKTVFEALKAEPDPVAFLDPIHPWMTGTLWVFDHPYFAVTDQDGRFEMPKVPVGKWRIMYQHENGYLRGRDGKFGFPVTVQDSGAAKQAMPPVEYEFPKID